MSCEEELLFTFLCDLSDRFAADHRISEQDDLILNTFGVWGGARGIRYCSPKGIE